MTISKNLKKILVAGASLLMLAGVGSSVNQVNIHAHSMFWTKWDKIPGVGEDQYESRFNKKVGAVATDKPITVKRNGHSMTIVPCAQIPGKIIKVDGHQVTSKSQILSRLAYKVRKRTRYHKRRYRVRTHRVWNKRYHTGYFYHGRWYHYKTGYFNRSWRWIANRKARRVIRRRKPRHVTRRKATPWQQLHMPYGEYRVIERMESSSSVKDIEGLGKPAINWYNQNWRKYTKPAVHRNHKRSSANLAKEEINLINQDRADNGESPLQESPALDQIAQIRAKQTYKIGELHYDSKNGKWYSDEVGYQLGDNDSPSNDSYGENLDMDDSSAKEANNDFYTNEKPSSNNPQGGGHYKNILGQYFNYDKVGVGVYNGAYAEEFSGQGLDNNIQ